MLPNYFSNKSRWQQLAFLLLFIVGGITIFGSLAAFVTMVIKLESGSRGYLYIVQTVTTFGVFFLPAVLFSYCCTKKWFSYSNADKIVPPSMVGIVVILSLFILPLVACLGYLNEQISLPESMQKLEIWMRNMEEAGKVLMQALTANSTISILLMNIMIMALAPALFEEFLFRGTIQPFFNKWFGNKHLAIIITAFIFSAIHFQFFGFLPRFLLGIYLGYLLIWSQSLWLPIVAHLMHNAMSLIFDFVTQKKGVDFDAVEPADITGFYPMVVFCAVCVGFGVYYLWKRKNTIFAVLT